jgi:hypothetical protein
VAAWLEEAGILPTHHTVQELDNTELFVCRAVASGEATPDEGYEALSGWYGMA